MEIWNTIVHTNTFNFIIFVALFALIIWRAKVGDLITGLQDKINKVIEESDSAKSNSELDLKKAEDKTSLLGAEIKEIHDEAGLTALRLGRKILADANQHVESIEINADKIADSEGKQLISKLSQQAALASVELAKRHIISTLKKKPQYHAKFIEDNIKEIDRFNF